MSAIRILRMGQLCFRRGAPCALPCSADHVCPHSVGVRGTSRFWGSVLRLQDLGLVFQLRHQLRDIRHPAAPRALLRRGVGEHLHPRRRVHPQRGEGNDLQFLLLRLHDAGKRRVPRLVQPQVRGHHRRERHLDRLQPAVHLAGHVRLLFVRHELDLRREGRLRPPEDRREDLPHLVVVVVDRLLPHQHEVGLFVPDDLRQHLRHGQRVEVRPRLDQHRAVGAHRQRRAHLLLASLRPDGHDDHLDVVQDDAAPVPLDLHLLVGVGDRLDGDQDLHVAPPVGFNASGVPTYRKRKSNARMNGGSIRNGAGSGRPPGGGGGRPRGRGPPSGGGGGPPPPPASRDTAARASPQPRTGPQNRDVPRTSTKPGHSSTSYFSSIDIIYFIAPVFHRTGPSENRHLCPTSGEVPGTSRFWGGSGVPHTRSLRTYQRSKNDWYSPDWTARPHGSLSRYQRPVARSPSSKGTRGTTPSSARIFASSMAYRRSCPGRSGTNFIDDSSFPIAATSIFVISMFVRSFPPPTL